jgi:hypothetical protein
LSLLPSIRVWPTLCNAQARRAVGVVIVVVGAG